MTHFPFIGRALAPAALACSLLCLAPAALAQDAVKKELATRIVNLQKAQDMDVSTVDAANRTLAIVDSAIAAISAQRANYGALQSRFETTIANLNISSENMSASRSRIQDADFAQESSALTQSQLIQQAATAMLAQLGQATTTWLPWQKMHYAEDGLALLDKALAGLVPTLSRERLKALILDGQVSGADGKSVRDPSRKVEAGQSTGLVSEVLPAAEIVARIAQDYAQALSNLPKPVFDSTLKEAHHAG